VRINSPINKDTQLHPLVRLQFRGLPEEDRKAFLFENVTDTRGRRFKVPVIVCALAGSTKIYSIGMMCEPGKIMERWNQALLHPIEPQIVNSGPVQEEVHMGDGLMEHGGLDEFPIPISTPGYDVAPYITSPYWVTRDPDTGIHNVGTYRVQIKSPVRAGIMISTTQKDISRHWKKCKEKARPLEAAIVIGASPCIGYTSVSRLPYGTSEFSVAGGIAGAPIELVKCKSVDLCIPAHSEIAIEGELSTNELEPEGPFGESMGFMARSSMMPYFTVKCITHRKDPIWHAFLSQFPASESSKIRQIAREAAMYKVLREDHKIPSVISVAAHESTGSAGLVVVQMKKPAQAEVEQVIDIMKKWLPIYNHNGKMLVVVDEDINPHDADAVNWAISFRVQPHRDCHIHKHVPKAFMDYSLMSPKGRDDLDVQYENLPDASLLLINATLKWPYPPVSLPKREFMEEALRIWQDEKLPPLKLKEPWWGYNLGAWEPEEEEQAARAIRGRYFENGELASQHRRKA
jgi:4-hydroxy-3-polyprenylbenzoate decarboxylase